MSVPVQLRRLDARAIAPRRMTSQAAGYDLAACLPEGEGRTLLPGERGLLPTGWAMALPPGYEAQVRPRSGLALRHGVTVLNAPGTIDADYRGEIQVLLVNLGREPWTVEHGQRIAQLVVAPVVTVRWDEVEAFPEVAPRERGDGGFGSTGAR